jgi:hypothetical protein
MRTEAASNPTCDHFGFSCRRRILLDLSNSDCLPGRGCGTPVGLGPLRCRGTLHQRGEGQQVGRAHRA